MPFNPLEAYNNGLEGARRDPRAEELLVDSVMRSGGDPDGNRNAYNWGLVGASKDKLSLLFPYVEQCYPGAQPGSAQLWGDCTAAAAVRVALASLCCEVILGRPDEETGVMEEAPEVVPEAVKHAVLSQESVFAWRGFDDDGWSCDAAAHTIMDKGFLLRQNYPSLGIDLTKYTEQTIKLGGARRPSGAVLAEQQKHRVRTVTVLKDIEEAGDYIASGFAVAFCSSSLKFSSSRNEDGLSERVPGAWAHSQGMYGFDARAMTVRKYGEPLVLVGNQWNQWNSGPRKILGTDIEIPHGFYWARSSLFNKTKAKMIAYSSIQGWQRKRMRDFGATGHI